MGNFAISAAVLAGSQDVWAPAVSAATLAICFAALIHRKAFVELAVAWPDSGAPEAAGASSGGSCG